MQLGETIATYDVALALRGESGKFDVTSPGGEIYHITCKPNHSITNLQWSGNGRNSQPFLIRKVAEPVSSAPETAGGNVAERPTESREAKTPFLIGPDANDPRSGDRHGADPPFAAPQPDPRVDDLGGLDLRYEDVGHSLERPTAWVCLRSEPSMNREKFLTKPCTTFSQFDAEIRRLHAQLDDIRYRARKKFYQAQGRAAGA